MGDGVGDIGAVPDQWDYLEIGQTAAIAFIYFVGIVVGICFCKIGRRKKKRRSRREASSSETSEASA